MNLVERKLEDMDAENPREHNNMTKHKGSMKGIHKARCVLAKMNSGSSKKKARRACGVKAKR